MHESVTQFMERHFHHFNAAELVRAARAYSEHSAQGGIFMVTLAGAMSTARLGLSLAEMIRQGKVHAISCTGANLEEDIFNLLGRQEYQSVRQYRSLSPQDDQNLMLKGLHRVTDVCIPEHIFLRFGERILQEWVDCDQKQESYFIYEYIYRILKDGSIKHLYQIDPKESWVVAACEKQIPIFTPGWEDSSLGNLFAAHCIRQTIQRTSTVRNGIDTMIDLTAWYRESSKQHGIGFFQIGGGIAGDFPICVVPMLAQDLHVEDVRPWAYFCQISDSTTSYGSYSGAMPSEKITWGKITATTPTFMIESDATIVAPLIFAYVLGW
ncbi:deoxyhypusine synthase family protein [Candidatus Viridilinea mediisalina]|uniref:Deoxyhypusine synthase n=1 Tax=Candidatus Viridilinea mediisalina TaxID=2024553 RepID=A0A2A6RIK0_9CHLR|nr:deoxyhypusine synthase family protein [Candidatus Viridilinea mediisalina]PDW02954.1 deoxyhypusine synthase [Candidatus Viridilinea mediisalina]